MPSQQSGVGLRTNRMFPQSSHSLSDESEDGAVTRMGWKDVPFPLHALEGLHFEPLHACGESSSKDDGTDMSSDDDGEEGDEHWGGDPELVKMLGNVKSMPQRLEELIEGLPEGKLTRKMNAEAFAKLEQLEEAWAGVTPQEFVMTLYALGPDRRQAEYLSALTVRVDAELLAPRQRKHVHRVQVMFATSQKWAQLRPLRQLCLEASGGSAKAEQKELWRQLWRRGPKFDPKRPGLEKRCPTIDGTVLTLWTNLRCKRHAEVVHRFSYTTATGLLDTRDPRDQAHMLKALLGAGRASLGTHMGRALIANFWLGHRFSFYLAKLLDVVHLLLLSVMTMSARHGHVPNAFFLWALILLCFWGVACSSLEVFLAFRLFKEPTGTAVGSVLFVMELFNAIAVGSLLWGALPMAGGSFDEGTCLTARHLNMFSLAILCKWVHFISSLLCLKSIGETVLPAAYTMASRESNCFLLFICLAIVASYNAYCVFPVPGTLGADGLADNATVSDMLGHEMSEMNFQDGHLSFPANVFLMVVQMFRLDTIGDFDALEMQGQDQKVELNGTLMRDAIRGRGAAPHVDGKITDPPHKENFHQGILILVMVLALFVHVNLMNIYIGVLSNVYNDYASRKWEILAEFKAVHALRYLLSSPVHALGFFDRTRCVYDAIIGVRDACMNPSRGAEEGETGGRWLAYLDEEFGEQAGATPRSADSETLEKLLRKVEEDAALRSADSERLERLLRKVEELQDKVQSLEGGSPGRR